MLKNIAFNESVAYQKLKDHFKNQAQEYKLIDLFKNDNERAKNFSIEAEGLFYDFSKNLVSNATLDLLFQLLEEYDLRSASEMMFNGIKINETEDRSVLHTALRDAQNYQEGKGDLGKHIKQIHQKLIDISQALIDLKWIGYSGKSITDIVNIGIGAQDLGVRMTINALEPFKKSNLNIHFVNNVDGASLHQVLNKVKAETTLFIISSKSFITPETQLNAESAKKWFLQFSSDIKRHFLAISMNVAKAIDFGIDPANIVELPDYAGGRFSIWGSTALPLICSIGYQQYQEFLAGGYSIDQHFLRTNYQQNIPVIMALLSIWYNNFFNSGAEVVVPYEDGLRFFVNYLQQQQMESNGKNIDRTGKLIKDYRTCPAIFGDVGNNLQHSFFQLIHQGTQFFPIDFLIGAQSNYADVEHRRFLVHSALAQSMALLQGKSLPEVENELKSKGMDQQTIDKIKMHKTFTGNRPSSTLLYKKLTPYVLGQLISLYEHKVFVEGLILNIYSFDQWGVELGKELTGKLLTNRTDLQNNNDFDQSTKLLINKYKEYQA